MKRVFMVCVALAVFSIQAGIAEDRSELWALDEATLFTYSESLDKASLVPAAAAALWPASFALICEEGQAFPAALAYAEAFALTYASKELLKWAVPRSRPYTYEDESLDGELLKEARESFPSGHTALAFCGATCFATLALELSSDRPATPWLVAGGYCFAIGTGALRVASGCHFLSDVVAGAALGSGIGWLVTKANIRFGPLGRSGAGEAYEESAASLSLSPSGILVNIRL